MFFLSIENVFYLLSDVFITLIIYMSYSAWWNWPHCSNMCPCLNVPIPPTPPPTHTHKEIKSIKSLNYYNPLQTHWNVDNLHFIKKICIIPEIYHNNEKEIICIRRLQQLYFEQDKDTWGEWTTIHCTSFSILTDFLILYWAVPFSWVSVPYLASLEIQPSYCSISFGLRREASATSYLCLEFWI